MNQHRTADAESLSDMIDRALIESEGACGLHDPLVACSNRTYAVSLLLLDRGVQIDRSVSDA